jgi:hypothetical protein
MLSGLRPRQHQRELERGKQKDPPVVAYARGLVCRTGGVPKSATTPDGREVKFDRPLANLQYG